jgi:hypothetical protein
MSQTVFELNDVRITAAVAQLGATTYQIANIGSVRVVQNRSLNALALIALVLGLALVVGAGVLHQQLPDPDYSLVAIGAIMVLAAIILQLVWPKRTFVLILNMASGDAAALTSRNRKYISDIKQAIEQAFIARTQAT